MTPRRFASITQPLQPSPTGAGTSATDSNGVAQPTVPASESQDSRATVTTPAYGVEDKSIDFGWFEVPFTEILVGDFLWIDANGDGVQQANALERPLAGVTVELRNAANTVIATTVTSGSGLYEFNGVKDVLFEPAQPYTITIPLGQMALGGLVPTVANSVSGTAATDSNGTPNVGNTQVEYAFTAQPEGPNVTFDL